MGTLTITDIKAHVFEQSHKDSSASAGSTDDNTVERWILRAIRYMQRHDFECWRNEFEVALTAGTYRYLYTDAAWNGDSTALVRPLRLDGNSVRYGKSLLKWAPSIRALDERMGGPSWKDSDDDGGTPSWVSEMGGGLVIAGKPIQAFIDVNASLKGYYYKGEDLSTSGFENLGLAMYDDFFEHIVNLALVFAMQQTDDSEFRTLLGDWRNNDLVEMRGYDHVSSDDESVPAPLWATFVDGAQHTY